jgi:hypothetical protein
VVVFSCEKALTARLREVAAARQDKLQDITAVRAVGNLRAYYLLYNQPVQERDRETDLFSIERDLCDPLLSPL